MGWGLLTYFLRSVDEAVLRNYQNSGYIWNITFKLERCALTTWRFRCKLLLLREIVSPSATDPPTSHYNDVIMSALASQITSLTIVYALMFSLISAWINGWVNSREVGDLRRNRAHYGVIVMHNAIEITRYDIKHGKRKEIILARRFTFKSIHFFSQASCGAKNWAHLP